MELKRRKDIGCPTGLKATGRIAVRTAAAAEYDRRLAPIEKADSDVTDATVSTILMMLPLFILLC
jgi:hypothetical protein